MINQIHRRVCVCENKVRFLLYNHKIKKSNNSIYSIAYRLQRSWRWRFHTDGIQKRSGTNNGLISKVYRLIMASKWSEWQAPVNWQVMEAEAGVARIQRRDTGYAVEACRCSRYCRALISTPPWTRPRTSITIKLINSRPIEVCCFIEAPTGKSDEICFTFYRLDLFL